MLLRIIYSATFIKKYFQVWHWIWIFCLSFLASPILILMCDLVVCTGFFILFISRVLPFRVNSFAAFWFSYTYLGENFLGQGKLLALIFLLGWLASAHQPLSCKWRPLLLFPFIDYLPWSFTVWVCWCIYAKLVWFSAPSVMPVRRLLWTELSAFVTMAIDIPEIIQILNQVHSCFLRQTSLCLF